MNVADAATIDVGAIPYGRLAAAAAIAPWAIMVSGFHHVRRWRRVIGCRLRPLVASCQYPDCVAWSRLAAKAAAAAGLVNFAPTRGRRPKTSPPHCGREGLAKGLRAYAALTVTTVSPEGKGRCGDREGHARSPTRRRARRQIPRVQRLPPSCSDRKSAVMSGIARSLRRVLTWARPWNGSQSCSSIRSRILL